MSTQTLFNIVDSIHVSKYRRSPHSILSFNTSPWTFQEQKLFLHLIMQYGADIGLIESFFPTRTRGQIKRKHRDITMARKKMLERFENKIIRQSRKSYFDEEILEQKMIKWISKPNKQGNSNSDQTI